MHIARWWRCNDYVFYVQQLFNLTRLELYITPANTPTQTCVHSPPISSSSLNLEGLDEYLNETMNLETSFEDPHPQFIWLLFYYLMICSHHVCFSLFYYWVFIMCVLMPKVSSMDCLFEVVVFFLVFGNFVNAFEGYIETR